LYSIRWKQYRFLRRGCVGRLDDGGSVGRERFSTDRRVWGEGLEGDRDSVGKGGEASERRDIFRRRRRSRRRSEGLRIVLHDGLCGNGGDWGRGWRLPTASGG
jgi:hypothetical protein